MSSNPATDYESEMDSDSNLVMMESMLCKEQTIYAQHDYFARSLPISPGNNRGNGMPVDPFCRNVMTKWCDSLCKFCSYDRRMVASVISCVDRFVATPQGSRILLDRDQYQLAVMASLYLVAKIQQTQALEPESVAKLSRGKYTKANIEDMELEILKSLKWFVNPPTPMGFAHEFVQNFNLVPEEENVVANDSEQDDSSSLSSSSSTTQERIMDLVQCQVEEATCDYELSCLTRPSHVAFGAVSNALESLNIDASQLDSMKELKRRLQIIDEEYISESLVRVVSSSQSTNNALSSLLLDRCSGQSSRRRRTKSQSNETKQSHTRTSSSSSVPSSPRTVLEGMLC